MLGYISQTGVNILFTVLVFAMFVLAAWALIDCATRRKDAFVAAQEELAEAREEDQ